MLPASGITGLPVGPTSGGKIYAFNNIGTGIAEVAPANASRTQLTFHNPGSVDIFIGPAFVQNTGSNVPLVPNNADLGGCIRLFANGGTWTVSGECQGSWNGFAASGSTNPLTVVDSNI